MTTKKTTTRENFNEAVNAATIYVRQYKRKYRDSHYCEMFLDNNKRLIKSNQNELQKLTKGVTLRFSVERIGLAEEKEGVLLKDDKGNLKFSKSGEQQLIALTQKTNDEIKEITDNFMDEEVQFDVMPLISKLSNNMDFETRKALQGFVVELVNEYTEE